METPINNELKNICIICMLELKAKITICGDYRHTICFTCFDVLRQDKENIIKCPSCRFEAIDIKQEEQQQEEQQIIIKPDIIELNKLIIQQGKKHNINKIYIGVIHDINDMETEDKKVIDLQNTNKYYNLNCMNSDNIDEHGIKTVNTRFYGLSIAHIRIFKHKTAAHARLTEDLKQQIITQINLQFKTFIYEQCEKLTVLNKLLDNGEFETEVNNSLIFRGCIEYTTNNTNKYYIYYMLDHDQIITESLDKANTPNGILGTNKYINVIITKLNTFVNTDINAVDRFNTKEDIQKYVYDGLKTDIMDKSKILHNAKCVY